MEKELHPTDSIRIIESMLTQTRENFRSRNGLFYLLWGWLTIAAALGEFYLMRTGYPQHFLPWVVLMPLGGIGSAILGARMERGEGLAQTYTDRVMSFIWISGGMLIFGLVFGAVMLNVSPNPFVMLAAGSLTFMSGSVSRFRAMQIGGAILYGFGFGSFFVSDELKQIFMAVAIAFGYLYPGYLLRRKA